MRYGSVCSGIEAASQAWHPLGWKAAFFSEIDKFPAAVLAHHYPHVPNHGDMTKFEEWPDDAIDLLVGGTPCQDYSIAGKRLGMAGDRGQLTLTFVEIAAHLRPRWLVWENVPGVLSSHEGRDFARFLGDLSGTEIDVPEGGWKNSGIISGDPNAYGLAYVVRDAQYVRTCRHRGAVPQRRRRVFVVGYLGDWRRAAAVLFDAESLSGNPPPRREAGQGAAPTLAARTRGGGGLGTDFDCDGGLIASHDAAQPLLAKENSSHRLDAESYVAFPSTGSVSHYLNAGGMGRIDYETETMVAHALRGEGFDASEDGTGRGTPIVPVAFSAKDYGGDAMENVSPTLRAGGHHESHANAGVMPAVAFDLRGRDGGAMPEGPHDTANLRAASGGSSRSYVAQPWAVRRLTPTECHRLQGFPDGFCDIPWRGKDHAPDGPQYKALGNSFAVNVAEWIGRRIELVERL